MEIAEFVLTVDNNTDAIRRNDEPGRDILALTPTYQETTVSLKLMTLDDDEARSINPYQPLKIEYGGIEYEILITEIEHYISENGQIITLDIKGITTNSITPKLMR